MELYACCSNTNDSATNWVTDSTRDLRDDGQSVINSQLVDSCDLLIEVFWTRIGTPTQ